MAFQTRDNIFTLYKILFILFLLMGALGIGCVLLDNLSDIQIVNVVSVFDKQTLHTILLVMSILGFCAALIMLYLIQERRHEKTDRRLEFRPVNFADRRNSTDRRSEKE